MEIPCPNCGTRIDMSATMCYACGARNDNPLGLDAEQMELFSKASKAMDNGDSAKALEYYDRLLELRPEISHLWTCKAIAHAMLDNKPEAWNNYTKAIRVDPSNPEPWKVRFEFAVENFRDKMDTHIEEYFEQFGRSIESLINMAEDIILLSPGDISIAIEYLDAVLNPDPKNKRAKKLMRKARKIEKRLH